jgi:tetratricopeptide (TPR) repeat protein
MTVKALPIMRFFIPSLLLVSSIGLSASVARAQANEPSNQAISQVATPCESRVIDAVICARDLFKSTSNAFLRNRDKKKAVVGYLKVAQLDPKYGPAWFNLGVLAEGSHSWVEAKSYFEKYLEVSPNGPESKRAAEEIETLTPYATGKVSLLQATEAEYDASVQRARIFMAANLYREAISETGHAQSLDDSRWEAYAIVGLCLKKQNKLEEANRFEKLAEERTPTEKLDKLKRAFEQ